MGFLPVILMGVHVYSTTVLWKLPVFYFFTLILSIRLKRIIGAVLSEWMVASDFRVSVTHDRSFLSVVLRQKRLW